jgi:hypothetical protein
VQSLESELRELLRLFNQEKVDYALCGGMAVALHGYQDLLDIKQLGLIPMSNREDKPVKRHRAITVDMSSEAITQRLREVGELHQLGMSLARAKPCEPQPSAAPLDQTRQPRS